MSGCQFTHRRVLRADPAQLKREVLFCRCVDCQDARAMNAGTSLSLRKAVRERVGALQWKPKQEPPAPLPPIEDETA